MDLLYQNKSLDHIPHYKDMRCTIKLLNFSDTKKLFCNLPKIQTNRPNLRVFHQKDANGIANSEDPDQTAPLGAV